MLKRTVLIAGLLCFLSGCITESTGGPVGPAPDEERIAAQLDLARGYLERRDFARAQAPLEKVLRIDSRNVTAHVLSAIALYLSLIHI